MAVNGHDLRLNEHFQPLLQSGSLAFSYEEIVPVGFGISLADGSYDDYADLDVSDRAVLIKRFAPETGDSTDVRFDEHSSLADKIFRAVDAGAAAVFFYTPPDHDDTIVTRGGVANIAAKEIPVIWLRHEGLKELGLDLSNPVLMTAEGEIEMIRVRDTGYNVLGLIPSDNDTTVIVGAHYDHLGYGDYGSFYRGTERKIHPGADDNGSGVAALLELARSLGQASEPLRYSYLLAAFTGEEYGLIGSGHLAQALSEDSVALRMMLNLDMIGRLRDQEAGLAIFGTGTCPEFKSYFDSLEIEGLKITAKEEGIGASDHTSFYSLDLPVMHFFTGAHEDYHSPDDVIGRLDTAGIVRVAQFIDEALVRFDQLDRPLEFRKTRSGRPGRSRGSFSVTLGIMPDHVAEVKGLKVGSVSAESAAEKAGIVKGDVIIKMGIRPIDDIYAYMNALGKYRKGDTTTVVVERDADTISLLVDFK